IPPIALKKGLPLSMTIVLTWYQLRKLAGSLRSPADSAAKAVMEPTTAADNRPRPALLLIRAHRAPFRIRSSVLKHILTLLMVHLLVISAVGTVWPVTLVLASGEKWLRAVFCSWGGFSQSCASLVVWLTRIGAIGATL